MDVARSKGMVLARTTTDLYFGRVPLCLPEKTVSSLPFLTRGPCHAEAGSLSPVLLLWMSPEEDSVVIILRLILATPRTLFKNALSLVMKDPLELIKI